MKTFFELVKSLPKDDLIKFRNRIMKVCEIQLPTWYSWLQREKVSRQCQLLIAAELNQPITTLFPET